MGLRRLLDTCCTARSRDTLALEAEDVYRILRERRRRLALAVLDELEADHVPLRELAREVAAGEMGAAPSDVPTDVLEATYVALYQSHLVVLERFDAVEWDRDASHVRPGPSLPGLAAVVQEVDRRTRR